MVQAGPANPSELALGRLVRTNVVLIADIDGIPIAILFTLSLPFRMLYLVPRAGMHRKILNHQIGVVALKRGITARVL